MIEENKIKNDKNLVNENKSSINKNKMNEIK
jgi:hypothetical protein